LANASLLEAFEKYQEKTEPLDSVANISFGKLSDTDLGNFSELCERMLAERIEGGVSIDDVLMLLKTHRLDSHMSRNPTQRSLQLVSIGTELRGEEFLYRMYRVLNF